MFYKDSSGSPFYNPSQKVIDRNGLTEIAESEFDGIVADINKTPDAVSATQRKIVDVLKKRGAWADYRAYIHADPDRYDAFYLSQEVRIDDPFIQDAIADPDFPLTQEEAQQIINAANGV